MPSWVTPFMLKFIPEYMSFALKVETWTPTFKKFRSNIVQKLISNMMELSDSEARRRNGEMTRTSRDRKLIMYAEKCSTMEIYHLSIISIDYLTFDLNFSCFYTKLFGA